MLLIVVLEGNHQIPQRRFPIRLGQIGHEGALDRLHEVLCHAVALRVAHRCGYLLQTHLTG